MNKWVLDGVSNPGWTFTEDRLRQLENFINWFDKINDNEKLTYRRIQELITMEDCNIDGSKVRMFFPFLKDLGFLNDYSNTFYKKDLLTKDGDIFFHFIIPLYLKGKVLDKDIISKINKLFSYFIFDGLLNISRNVKKPVYKMMTRILIELNEIDTNEFFIITDSLEKNKEKQYILDKIKEFRENKSNIEIEINKNKNALGYTVPFFEQSGAIFKNGNKIKLNQSIVDFLEDENE